jgi:hypothetical protein
MTIDYTYLPFPIPRPSKICPDKDLWFENLPSGNPVLQYCLAIHTYLPNLITKSFQIKLQPYHVIVNLVLEFLVFGFDRFIDIIHTLFYLFRRKEKNHELCPDGVVGW